MKLTKKAFMLMELLVVVLIIGILAAVAVPQYQKAVQKSKNIQLKQLVKTLGVAQQTYFLANGEYASTFAQLGIDIPLEDETQSLKCSIAYSKEGSRKRGENFQLYITQNPKKEITTVAALWKNGPYQCTGFRSSSDSNWQLQCFDLNDTNGNSKMCTQIEHGVLTIKGSSSPTEIISSKYAL